MPAGQKMLKLGHIVLLNGNKHVVCLGGSAKAFGEVGLILHLLLVSDNLTPSFSVCVGMNVQFKCYENVYVPSLLASC